MTSRESVLDAAADLFAANGFVDTRVNDIAAAARVSKPFLYRLFRGKQAIYAALLEREEAYFTRLVIGPIARATTSDLCSCSARVLTCFWRFQIRRPAALRILLGPQDWRVEQDAKTALRHRLEEQIGRTVARCGLPRGDAAARAHALLLVAFALSTAEVIRAGRADRTELHELAKNGVALMCRLGATERAIACA